MKFDDIRRAYLTAAIRFTDHALVRMEERGITVVHILGAIRLGYIEQAKDGITSFSGSFCVVTLQPVVNGGTAVITVIPPRPMYNPSSLDNIKIGQQRKSNKKRPRVYDLDE
jgi:hypothetical protein